MTTNYEWLLNMGGAERQAWFDAEHNDTLSPENVVTSGDVDANDANADTREKLEEDVNAYIMQNIGSNITWEVGNTLKLTILALLDRQATITTKECTLTGELACEACRAAQKRRLDARQRQVDGLERELRKFKDMNNDVNAECAELQAQVDELTAERDELRCCLMNDGEGS